MNKKILNIFLCFLMLLFLSFGAEVAFNTLNGKIPGQTYPVYLQSGDNLTATCSWTAPVINLYLFFYAPGASSG